jgi:hypothetical protein
MNELFMLTDSVWLSATIWALIGITFLYLVRLAPWQGRVEQSGGTWRVINDLDR